MTPEECRKTIEADWANWLGALAPHLVTLAPHHLDFWDWVWRIAVGKRPSPRVEIWPRGHGKTTAGELATRAVAATGRRRYGIYVTRTQAQANQKIGNIAAGFEDSRFALYYPRHADRMVTKFGHSRGWKVDRLRTAGGFTLDAVGLDKASRGLKIEAQRPDWIWIDDIDEPSDSVLTVRKHLERLSRSVLPARSADAGILVTQNLVSYEGVVGQIASRQADLLADAQIIGPIPAVHDFSYEQTNGRYVVTGGEPTWPHGFGLDQVEVELNTSSPSAFLAEHQHVPLEIKGDVFGHINFESLRCSQPAPLDRIIVRVDPATQGTAKSSQGVCAGGRGRDGMVYFLAGYEGRSGPLEAVRLGIRMALSVGATEVGIEKTQGHRTWESVWKEALVAEGAQAKGLRLTQPDVGGQGKPERLTQMLAAFELGRVRILEGTHHVMEAALSRFPQPPDDLADAMWHVWDELRSTGKASSPTLPTQRIVRSFGEGR